jgi:NADH dehydrogenase (ubiquinone) Fe-S protein 1
MVVRAVSEVSGVCLPYDDAFGMRERLAQVAPHLVRPGVVEPSGWVGVGVDTVAAGADKKKVAGALEPVIKNFYMTDPISRASSTMAQCSLAFVKNDSADEAHLKQQQA